jgi:carbon-monoxide dehydrogenase medium subunit
MSGEFLHFDYLMPKTIREACSLLSKHKGKANAVAGGTDLLVLIKSRQIMPQYIINLKTIPNLNYIDYADGEGLRIGALATMYDVESSPIIQEKFPILASAAHQVGSPNIRNMATIGGNLCRAAPSADTAPPLIGLGAKVKIVGFNRERTCGVEEFFLGPGACVLQSDEILTEIQIPNPPSYTRGVYLKMPAGKRISIAAIGVAVVVTLDAKQANIVDAKIVLGAVAPTPIRASKAEDIIKGKAIDDELIEKAAQAAAEEAKPISDIRAPANYRQEMVKVLTARALRQVTAST